VVPPNGYLDDSGDDWECERHFRKTRGSCIPLAVPENAHVAGSGNDWSCDTGFRRQGEICAPGDR
jgi:hypothetical protein